jgi:hypothetical protein
MIVVEQENEILKAHVYGEMTLDDFREFEEAVAGELKQFDHVNIIFDMSNMTGFSLDAALEEVRFNKAHANDYRKIAVVTVSQWLAWVGWFTTAFGNADVRQFDDVESASTWLKES